MDMSREVVRLNIEGRWTAEEFGLSLTSLSHLYDLRLFLEYISEDYRDFERFYEKFFDLHPFRRIREYRSSNRGPLSWPGFGIFPPILDEGQLSRLSLLFTPEERLEIRRIEYASPGFSDLAGLGEIMGHIKDLILKLLERHDSHRLRELSEERAALENDRIRLENARKYVALARDIGYTEMEVRSLVVYVLEKQEPIFQLVESKKLRGISKADHNSEQ